MPFCQSVSLANGSMRAFPLRAYAMRLATLCGPPPGARALAVAATRGAVDKGPRASARSARRRNDARTERRASLTVASASSSEALGPAAGVHSLPTPETSTSSPSPSLSSCVPPWLPVASPAWPEMVSNVEAAVRLTVVAVDPDLSGAIAVLWWDDQEEGGTGFRSSMEEGGGMHPERSMGGTGKGMSEGSMRNVDETSYQGGEGDFTGRLESHAQAGCRPESAADGTRDLEGAIAKVPCASECLNSLQFCSRSTRLARVSLFDLPTVSVATTTRTRRRHDVGRLVDIIKNILREHSERAEEKGAKRTDVSDIAGPTSSFLASASSSRVGASSLPPRLPPLAMLEAAIPSPLSGKHSWFSAGYSAGLFEGVLSSLDGFPPEAVGRVPAVVWKRDLGLWGGGKAASLELARELFPQAAGQLERKRDHGRAEALLIAAWAVGCRRQREEHVGGAEEGRDDDPGAGLVEAMTAFSGDEAGSDASTEEDDA